ncbi:alpha-ribazole phosphatase family protein [Pseudomonas alkylphenolica]|uniref:alpha-ribazole phosphatase family protein n=1 Tax=Pseudomonas alkylphenolica TaxID=237609 RepID=UPI0018D6B615|nr:alpha-ribazole phosphatase family protein [Pseudomonas alkylphenolica]MBH3430716.1 alpha-ribazole phosphatase family protein [Pseudomonas alkylphenolica]
MIIELLRHGETERGGGLRGSLDDALTATGWAQMQAAVDTAGPWDGLVSSPLQRCAAFARQLGEQTGQAVQLAPGLKELHFGEWEGRSAAELMLTHEQQLGQFWSDPYAFTPPGGEAVIDFSKRVLHAITDLHREHAGKHLLVVTHGGVMRLLLARARGLPREQLLQVEVGHGALCRLEVLADGSLREVC